MLLRRMVVGRLRVVRWPPLPPLRAGGERAAGLHQGVARQVSPPPTLVGFVGFVPTRSRRLVSGLIL